MQTIQHLTVIFILLSIVGCTNNPTSRTPSSLVTSKSWGELRDLKQRKVELNALKTQYQTKKLIDHIQKKKYLNRLTEIQNEEILIDEKIKNTEMKITVLKNESNYIDNVITDWRIEKEKIELANIRLYELDKNAEYSISTYEASETIVKISHNFFTMAGYKHPNEYGRDRVKMPVMDFTIRCDAPVKIKDGLLTKTIPANKIYKFQIADLEVAGDPGRMITVKQDMNACDLRFVSSLDETKKQYGFKIVNETKKLKNLDSLLSTTEICTLKSNSHQFIDTNDFLNLTCPKKYDTIKILPEPEDSLEARVMALTGKSLPEDFIKNANPYAELDFSKAPKFDAILVSYLVFRADFYGTLMARLLAYHADQGAIVRIIVSEVIALGKDNALYEKMMVDHPNIKVTKYRFEASEKGAQWISEFHRSNHVKLFAGYSTINPNESFVIVGGRNIHDGFVFKKPVDVSKFLEIVTYASGGDESWAYMRDFEMVIKGQEFVKSLSRDFMNFYHINKENLVMKLSSVVATKDQALEAEDGSLRHYISIPFNDQASLSLFYARMLDSAKKKVLISTPYFRPLKEVEEAINRAVERGVDVTIITRLDLEGDTASFILGSVNKDGVNRFMDKVKIFEYTEPKVILHSKLLMVDDEFSFISSVNLNKRSFFHDLENGVIINDTKFTKQMGLLYQEYLKNAQQLTDQQKIIFWKKMLINILDKAL